MRVAITGPTGQLGRSLCKALSGHDLVPLGREEYDVTDSEVISEIALSAPEVIIHTAAVTDVDGCELNPDRAYLVNTVGCRNVALASQACSARMVYLSTDYVFDGEASKPYLEFDDTNPVNVYGKSKLAGEVQVQTLLHEFYIVRTGWMFGVGGRNFVEKVLELASKEQEMQMVTTQVGSPTYALDLAEAIARLIEYPLYGIYHLTNGGSCSRYEFAKKILELAAHTGLVLRPCEEYATAARRPNYSVLRNLCAASQLGITLRPWEAALRAYFEEREGAESMVAATDDPTKAKSDRAT